MPYNIECTFEKFWHACLMKNLRHQGIPITSTEFFPQHQWAAGSGSLLDALGWDFHKVVH